MGRVISNINSLNLSNSSRTTESSFSDQVPKETIGPQVSAIAAGEAYGFSDEINNVVYSWKAMTVGDEGLKQAIYNFINKSKEGVNVEPDLVVGRQKRMLFNFFGTIGKSIAPGEIGSFEVIFQYPPAANSVSSTSESQNNA